MRLVLGEGAMIRVFAVTELPGWAPDCLVSDRRGVTAVEYGVVAAFLCLSLLGIFSHFAGVLTTMFTGVTTGI